MNAPCILLATVAAAIVPTMAAEQPDPGRIGGSLEAHAPELGRKFFLPLLKTEVRMEMLGSQVATEVCQEFKNQTAFALEAVYLFPLPSQATITGMELGAGRRVIRSEVLSRDEAQLAYDRAKAGGHKAALLEQQRPNLFTTSVATLLPGETARICFSYLHQAEFSLGKYSLSFPMVVGPRYVPASAGVDDAARITAPMQHPTVDSGHRVHLSIGLAGIPVGQVRSNTHPLRLEKVAGEEQRFEITLRDGQTAADRDLHVEIHMEERDMPSLSFLATGGGKQRAPKHGLLSVFPPLDPSHQPGPRPRDVIFVVDTSGSMAGSSIGQARSGLERCLGELGEEDAFAIVRFSTRYSSFAPELRPVSSSTIRDACSFVSQLAAGGGTEMQPALRYALGFPGRDDAVRLVVFLTDGDVGNEEQLVRLLDSDLGEARLFALGIGSAPNEFLLRKMAEAGRGQARFIHSHADIGDAISDLFRTLERPVLTDIDLVWKDADGRPMKQLICYPNPCPDVFHNRPLQVLARLPKRFSGGTVELTGRIGAERVTYHYPVVMGGGSPDIATLFGRARIDDLMQRRLLAGDDQQRNELAEQITRLGLEYQLITPFTSRVAVDRHGKRLPISIPPRRIDVPLQAPHGWYSGTGQHLADARLSFPKPCFIGTPVQVRLPNLEPPGRPRLALSAPPEAILLSLGKQVSSSDQEPIIGNLEMVTDGDKDGSEGSYVELGPGSQWVQIDLGKCHELHAVVLWHYHRNARAYIDVIVQISDDPTFRSGVTTIYNNDHDDSSGLHLGRGTEAAWIETNHGRIIDIPGRRARYLRLYSAGNTANEMNHYVEVEVFGLPG